MICGKHRGCHPLHPSSEPHKGTRISQLGSPTPTALGLSPTYGHKDVTNGVLHPFIPDVSPPRAPGHHNWGHPFLPPWI